MSSVLQGKVEGKRGRNRTAMIYIDNTNKDSGLSLSKIVRRSEDRDDWQSVVAKAGAGNFEHGDAERVTGEVKMMDIRKFRFMTTMVQGGGGNFYWSYGRGLVIIDITISCDLPFLCTISQLKRWKQYKSILRNYVGKYSPWY